MEKFSEWFSHTELLETYNYIQEGVLFAIVYFYFLQFLGSQKSSVASS